MKIQNGMLKAACALLGSASIFLGTSGVVGAEELLHLGYESGKISPRSGIDAQRPEAKDSIDIDCTVARAGRCSLRTTLRRTDSYISFGNYRAETDAKALTSLRYSPGDSYRYGFSVRTDEHWQFDNPQSIDAVWQFKRFDSHADMFVAIKGHDLVLRILNDGQFVLKKDFQPGKWMDIMMDVSWSNQDKGLVGVYLREEGEQSYRRVVYFEGPNMFDGSPKAGRPKWGLYKPAFTKSDFDGPRIVYHDEVFVDKLN